MGSTATETDFAKTVQIGMIDTGHPRRATVTVEIEYKGGRLSIVGTAARSGASDIDQGGQMQDTIRAEIENETIHLVRNEDDVVRLLDVWDRWHLNDMRPECEHQRALGWREYAREERTVYHWRLRADVRRAVRDALQAASKALIAGETVTLDAETRVLAANPEQATTETADSPSPLYEPERDTTYSRSKDVKTRGWLRPTEHSAGLLGKPCPECGYRYGTAWLKEDVPADVLDFLRGF